jgi:hypothetical protein
MAPGRARAADSAGRPGSAAGPDSDSAAGPRPGTGAGPRPGSRRAAGSAR